MMQSFPVSLDLAGTHSLSEGDRLLAQQERARRQALSRNSGFSPQSYLFSHAYRLGQLTPEDMLIAERFFTRCNSLSRAELSGLSKFLLSCSAAKKPAKVGLGISRAKEILKDELPVFCALALDARLLATPKNTFVCAPLEQECLRLLARKSAGAPEIILQGCVGRACFSSLPDALEIMLSFDFPAERHDLNEHQPMHLVCRQFTSSATPGSEECVLRCGQALLRSGIDPNAPLMIMRPKPQPVSPLFIAAQAGNWRLVGALLDAGGDPFLSLAGAAPSIELLLASKDTDVAARARALLEQRDLRASLQAPQNTRAKPRL